MIRSAKYLSVAALTTALAACGGGGSASGGGATGTMSLGLTDAPTDMFTKVNITFTGVTLKPADGDTINFTFDAPKTLDLLKLQNGVSASLLEDEEVPAGHYNWIRLTLDEDKLNAYNGDTVYKLVVPSGGQTGLKLVNGFTVAEGGDKNFTIDFDVRKSIVDPKGSPQGASYFLKPALRLIDNLRVGSITGDVDYAAINQDPALMDCSAADHGSVYIYAGADVTPTDINVNEPDNGPLTTVAVTSDPTDSVDHFKAAFLTEGDYTLSYTCQTDDNETTDKGGTLEFIGTQNVTVVADKETKAETIPLAP